VSPQFAALERLSTVKEKAENQARALERQHTGNEQLARLLGGTVGAHYCDPDKSAYKEGVVRPEFDKCLRELDQWDGLLASDLDRVTRDPAIGEVIIKRVRECSNPVVYTRNPEAACGYETFDLSTERGREAFRTNILAIRREARKASERQASRHEQWRDAGRPVGARGFGEQKGKLALDDREAGLIREAALDLLAGKPLWHIHDEWKAAGVLGPRGAPITRTSLRNLFLCPRLAGWRVHQQTGLPRSQWIARDSITGEPIRSLTPPILTQEVWEAVCSELEGRKQSVQSVRNTNRARYLLSGLVVCETCTERMMGQWIKKRDRHCYRCPSGCGIIHGPELDRHITSLLLGHWAQAPELVPDVKPFQGEAEIARLTEQLEQLSQARVSGLIPDLAEYLEEKGKVNTLLKPLEAERRKWQKAQVTPQTLGSAELWAKADLDGRRLMAKRELDMVKVDRAQRGLKAFDPKRVQPVWR
jgi:site-specific DNA recombinase